MLTKGGHSAAAGTYWNMTNGERVDMEIGGVLPGNESAIYLKAPAAAMLAAGPVLGLIFAVFLPLIGIVMTANMIVRKVTEDLTRVAGESFTFGWRPVEAYLAGKKQKNTVREKKTEKTR